MEVINFQRPDISQGAFQWVSTLVTEFGVAEEWRVGSTLFPILEVSPFYFPSVLVDGISVNSGHLHTNPFDRPTVAVIMDESLDKMRAESTDGKYRITVEQLPVIPVNGKFYWVKIKPYHYLNTLVTPGWEPMRRVGGKWHRAGVFYQFRDDEIEQIGAELNYE